MKIAVYSNGFPKLSQTFVDNQVNDFIKHGVDVDLLTNDFSGDYGCLKESVKVIDFKKFSENYFLRKIIFICLFLQCLLCFKINLAISILSDKKLQGWQKLSILSAIGKNEKYNYDLILVHFGNLGYYVTKMREVGVLEGEIGIIFHAYELARYRLLRKNLPSYEYIFNVCDFFFPVSDFWKNKLISLGCDNKKIHVIHMGINTDDFIFKHEDNRSDCMKIIQVGRLTKKKGILDTINALALLKDKMSFELDVVGDGDLLGAAQELVTHYGLANKVNFHGPLSNSQVKEMLTSSDLYILPSKTADDGDMEGIPVALMEAMAIGTPVISTYHSGIPELVENCVTGYLIEEGNIEGLSESIYIFSKAEYKERFEIAKKAREKVVRDFNGYIETKKLIDTINIRKV